jgi:hypothetical protein
VVSFLNVICIPFPRHSCYMPCSSGEEYKLWSFPLCTSSLLGQNILLATLFSNSPSLCSTLNLRHQISHSHKIRGKNYITAFVLSCVGLCRADPPSKESCWLSYKIQNFRILSRNTPDSLIRHGTRNYSFVCFNFYFIRHQTGKQEILNGTKHFPNNLILISSLMQFWFVSVVPK